MGGRNSKARERAWTDDDLRTLLHLAGKVPLEEIAATLGRGIPAVRSKATKQGIKLKVES